MADTVRAWNILAKDITPIMLSNHFPSSAVRTRPRPIGGSSAAVRGHCDSIGMSTEPVSLHDLKGPQSGYESHPALLAGTSPEIQINSSWLLRLTTPTS
jgi:hypothetical protein